MSPAVTTTAPSRRWFSPRPWRGVPDVALRITVVVALVVDAVVHLRLAGGYQLAFPDGVGGGTVFRLESVMALAVAVLVLWWGDERAHGAALVVLLSAFVAVVLYRYVPVPTLGPLPSMYEPVWFTEKSVSAVAEGVGALAALLGLLAARRSAQARSA